MKTAMNEEYQRKFNSFSKILKKVYYSEILEIEM